MEPERELRDEDDPFFRKDPPAEEPLAEDGEHPATGAGVPAGPLEEGKGEAAGDPGRTDESGPDEPPAAV